MGKPLLGVDVSEFQGTIDWLQYKESGHSFAEIKATEGLRYYDPFFARNWQHAGEHKVIRLAYHYLRPEFNGAQQASFLHSCVRASGKFSLGDGVMLDLEEMDKQSPSHVLTCAESFVTQILKETKAGVFLYCNYDFWINQLGSPRSTILGKCPLHQASWHSNPSPIPNWPNGPSMQQYAADGRVPGIPEQVDLDWFFGDVDTLKRLCRLGGRH